MLLGETQKVFVEKLKEIKNELTKDNSEFQKSFQDNLFNLSSKTINLTTLFKIFDNYSRKLQFNLMPFYDNLVLKYGHSIRGGVNYDTCKESIKNLSEVKYIEIKKSWNTNKLKSSASQSQEITQSRKEKMEDIILKRSLFILKMKFEKYRKDFIEILQYNTSNLPFKITINKFIRVITDIFHRMHFTIHQYTSPQDILDQKSTSVLQDSFFINNLFFFMFENRDHYNNLIKQLKNVQEDLNDKVIDQEKIEENFQIKEKEILRDQTNNLNHIEKGIDINYVNNFTTFPNSIPYLLFDSIPYILNDFLIKSDKLYVIDTQNDVNNKVKELFDAELRDLVENKFKSNKKNIKKEIKINQMLLEKKNLEINIDFFVERSKNKDNSSSQIIGRTVEKMKENVEKIEKDIENLENEKPIPVKRDKEKLKLNQHKEKPDELRLKSLKEIFDFYSKLHYSTKKKDTFDNIKEIVGKIFISEYMKFCSDFMINLSKEKIVNILKNRPNMKELSFEDFVISLNDICMKLNDLKIKHLEKRINILKSGYIPESKLNKGKIPKSQRLENLICDKKLLNFKNENLIQNINEKDTKSKKEDNIKTCHEKIDNKPPKETPNIDKNKQDNKNITPNQINNNPEQEVKIKKKMFGGKNDRTSSKVEKKPVDDKEIIQEKTNKNTINQNVEVSVKQSIDTHPAESQLFTINLKQKNINIPISSTQKILSSDVPKKIDKYKDLKEILKDEKKKNKELIKCESILQDLKNSKYTEIQDDFFKFLEIDINYSFRGKMKGYIYPSEGLYDPNCSIVEETIKMIERKKEVKKKKKLEIEREIFMKEMEEKKENFNQNQLNQKKYQRLRMKENKYSEINEKKNVLQKEKTRSMSWEDLIKVDLEYFVTNKEDDFNPKDFLELNIQDNNANDSLLQNSFNNKKENDLTSQTTALSSQEKSNIKSSKNPNSTSNKSSENISLSSKTKVRKNITTEQRAKEFEKELGDKMEKVIQINNILKEKGLNRIKKFYKE